MKKTLISVITLTVIGLSTLAFAAPKLDSIIVITRHGSRAPFGNFQKNPYKWPVPNEQLTPLGIQEEYELGQALRERYITNLQLMSDTYEDGTINALASYSDRTIQSAQALLIGLYPPGTGPVTVYGKDALPDKIQIVPIRTVSSDSILFMRNYETYITILKKYVYNSEAWQEKNKELESNYKKWSEITGTPINNLADLLNVGDVLICAKTQNLPLPEGLSEKDAEIIINATNWGLAEQFKNMDVSYLMGSEMLNKITSDLQNKAEGKDHYKMYLYSGHDITILPLMALFGTPMKTDPKYAANLVIELYKDGTQNLVKVRYDGKYVKLPMMNGESSCTLETFIKNVEEVNQKYSSATI